MACVNLTSSWTTVILHSFSQNTDLFMKVIMKCVNIKFWDILGCFHYILNAPRTFLFGNIIFNFQLGLKSALLACHHALKNALLAWWGAFKSALLACCYALKVPFYWKLYHALFWGWGKHYRSHMVSSKPEQN